MSQPEGQHEVDIKRRRVLIATTAAVGAVGGAAAIAPFVNSWYPSAKAEAAGAPTKVDVTKIEPGQLLRAEYRGAPVYVVNRTKEMVDLLPKNDPNLSDANSDKSVQPEYAKNATRSRTPELLVVSAICTHLGCAPNYRPEVGAADLGGDSWYGGFFCPCHGSKYDLSGRVYKSMPAPTNLPVPEYNVKDGILTIGEA